MRDHHLRERRLKLGLSQYDVGCVAGFIPRSAQSAVSAVERTHGNVRWAGPVAIRKVRSALIWLECRPRREREEARQEVADVAATEAAIAATPMDEARLFERLLDLLCNGRGDDFDALAARIPDAIAERAGNEYLDLCQPSATNGE